MYIFFSLSQENLTNLTWGSYVVAPKPNGTRYLLYVDSTGDVYLENQSLHFFRMDRAIQLLSPDMVVVYSQTQFLIAHSPMENVSFKVMTK